MRYAGIDEFEVANGEKSGISLFVQGCDFHCVNCFNNSTWDFEGGKEWTDETGISLANLLSRQYIKRISLLGGEPLADKNVSEVYKIIKDVRQYFPDKRIWLYSGYTWEEIFSTTTEESDSIRKTRAEAVRNVDVLVDGRYIDALRDLTLQFRGSSNQRIIDVKASLNKGEVCLWERK